MADCAEFTLPEEFSKIYWSPLCSRESTTVSVKMNIAQKQISQFLPHGKRIRYSESFIYEGIEGSVQFYLITKTCYELQIKDSFPWAILQSHSEMAAGVHV